jgi:hypothetical protein
MRKLALAAAAAFVVASPIAFAAARGGAASKPDLPHALARTSTVSSLHYTLHVRIRKDGMPLALRVRGASDAGRVSVHLASAGMTGAALLDGAFLYEEAPNGVAVFDKIRWLRLTVARLSPASQAMSAVRALTPAPLIRVVREARLVATSPRVFRGAVRYDDPIVRRALRRLTGNLEFRGLRVTVSLGRDGRVHRVLLTGRTADKSATLALSAHLFGFGRPVHLVLPKPGTFMDEQLAQLAE